jgi:hypothetical protein
LSQLWDEGIIFLKLRAFTRKISGFHSRDYSLDTK